VKRREFIAGLGGAAAWPLAARAQQQPIPVVVDLQFGQSRGSLDDSRSRAWVTGLREAGFDNGRNVIIEPVPAPNVASLPAVVAAQVQRKVAAIFGSLIVVRAAKAATNSIPLVFATTDDPLSVGFVESYNHPGGNVTGVRMRAGDEPAKLFELLRALVPAVGAIGIVGYRGMVGTAQDLASIEAAARSMGVQPIVTFVSSEKELEAAFAELARAKVGGVFINDARYFDMRRKEIIGLASRYGLPVVSLPREFAIEGGLASYGADYVDTIRQAGVYVGRILNGESPADLPILQPTKFVLTINLKTAKALDLNIPPLLLARADEVIE
jgi:putative tryptophan/tyrosine transport system substrate-binding protein